MADSAPVLMWMLEPTGRVTFFNQSWLRFTGRTREEEIGGGWEEMVHPDDRRRLRAAFEPALITRSGYEIEYRLRRHDGEYRWVLEQAGPRFLPDGTFAGLTGTTVDITDRREAEEAIRRSEERYRELFENANDLVYTHDLENRLTSLNRAAELAFGYTRDEALGMDVDRVVSPEHVERTSAMTAFKLAGGGPTVYETEALARDGRRTPLEISSSLLLRDGAPVGVQVIGRDITERKRAEEAVRESEARFRTMADSAPVLLWMADAEGKPAFFNRGWLDFTGRTLEEALGDGWKGLHPDDLEPSRRAFHAAVERRSDYELEYRLLRRDGEYRWIRDRAVPRFFPDGGFAGLTGVATDITERKLAQEVLRRREAILEAVSAAAEELLRATPSEDVIDSTLAQLGRAADVSRAYIFENSLGEGAVLMSQTHEWVAAGVTPQLDNPNLSGLPYPEDWGATLARDETINAHVRERPPAERAILEPQDIESILMVPIFAGGAWWGLLGFDECRVEREWSSAEIDALRAAAGILGAAFERRRTEAALRESEERFRQLADNLDECFWLSLPTGEDIYVSPAFEKIWGRAYGDRQAYRDTVHPEDRERVFAALDLMAHEPYDLEFRVVRPDGSVRWVHDRSFHVLDESGEVDRVAGIAADVTERKRAEEERRRLEEQARHSQKLESIGMLAGGIAHDFNNLLMGVLGNAELALLELPPGSLVRQRVEQVEKAAFRAAELTNQMLAYAGKARFVVEPVDLSQLVEEMAHLLSAAISKKAVLRFDLTTELPAVEADATQLRQVVMNLITNASDAIGERSGVITARTGVVDVDRSYLARTYLSEDLAEGQYVYVEVADTGCGMDEETKARVFDPFFTTKFTGRGLGLASALGIVRAHGGAVRVESEPGEGTTFRILLPAAARPAVAPEPDPPPAELRIAGGTVLVVDDEEAVRNVARAVLERAGFSVLTAGDGREGVEVFRAHADEVGVVVLDLTMPVMSGAEALRELRAVRDDVRVVLSSGYAEQDSSTQLSGDSVSAFVQKPYRPAELVSKVVEALEA